MNSTGTTRNVFLRFLRKPEFSVLCILAVMIVTTAILQADFFAIKSIVRNINAFAPLILLTMGQAIVIISGGIDLSSGMALSLMTCVMATVMKKNDPITGVYAILAALAAALVIGAINGFGIGYLRLPPVIVTFATSFIWLGAGLLLRPTPGGESVDWFKGFYNLDSVTGMPQFWRDFSAVIPPALILILIASAIWIVVSRTRTGRYIYAVGSNNDSAYASGINTARTQMIACILNSIFIFLAALFFVGQSQSGDARMGDPMTLKAIAAAVVGGVALSGGRGGVFYALAGAVIMNLVSKIIFFANIPNEFQTLVSGLIVIVAISGSFVYTLNRSKKTLAKEGK